MNFNIEEYPPHWNIRKLAEKKSAAESQEIIHHPRYRMDNWIREQQLMDKGYLLNSDYKYPW
jgi:hypothetical protein